MFKREPSWLAEGLLYDGAACGFEINLKQCQTLAVVAVTAAGNVLPHLRRTTDFLGGGLSLLGFNSSGLGRCLPVAAGWMQSGSLPGTQQLLFCHCLAVLLARVQQSSLCVEQCLTDPFDTLLVLLRNLQ